MTTLITTLAFALEPAPTMEAVADPDTSIDLVQSFEEDLEDGDAAVVMEPDRAFLMIGDPVRFKPDKAKLARGERKKLRDIAEVLVSHPDQSVALIGHTADRPLVSGRYDDHEELSTARAKVVRNMLIRRGVDARQMTVDGRAQTEPTASNAPVAKQVNRRVDVRVVPAIDPHVLSIDGS